VNTKEIAAEYRLTRWAGIIEERQESGLTIKAFCERSGFHENIYYYWQKKLREAAYNELQRIKNKATGSAPQRFTEVQLTERYPSLLTAAAGEDQVCIEAAGVRIVAGSEYSAEKLSLLLREVLRL
jgi:hypothetical protein